MTALAMASAEQLYRLPWSELQERAWQVRAEGFAPRLGLAVPGARHYTTEDYANEPHRFAAISLTGRACALDCAHCGRRLLETMFPAPTPGALAELGRRLRDQGCHGVLISGGADAQGRVPFSAHLDAIAGLKALGLRVIVHTGLVDAAGARDLARAGVDQALFDIIGDEDTIREVYGLPYRAADYERSLALLREAGLVVAPHIVAGLHFGQFRGELRALEMVCRVGADVLVVVVLRPLPGSRMAGVHPPVPEEVGRLVAAARLLLPHTPLTLGCARPAGRVGAEMEALALRAGVNALAYPYPDTVRLAATLGLETAFQESCCTLVAG
jgi:lipoyl synthase